MQFKKKSIIPIIVPDMYFTDMNGQCNRYNEMNPSLYIDADGNVTILVRCVNYRKINLQNFIMYELMSKSKYCLIRGKIDPIEAIDIENYEYSVANIVYDVPTYPTYWEGIEDVRFLNNEDIIAIVPELNVGGKPSIFKAKLTDSNISQFKECYPNHQEKNWMPFGDKVVYSLSPFMIKSVDVDDLEEINVSEENKVKLQGYHGSTNGIEIKPDEWLFLIHKNNEIVEHRWMLFNKDTRMILSEPFTFFKNAKIEFPCSLCKYKDRVFISLGVNDEKAFIIEACYNDIEMLLYPEPTIISMFYDIRALEGKHIERNRKVESYVDFSKQFLLKLPYPLILFTDSQVVHDIIFEYRRELGLLDKTRICMREFKDTYFYKDLDRITELQTTFFIKNGELEHETPRYVILNNNKFDCVDKAIELDPYRTSHYMWVDFGINHVAQSTERIHEWIHQIPDKIKQLCLNPYVENDEPKSFFQYIYHHTAGGLFSGSAANMMNYSRLFKEKTAQIYSEGWYQIDEAVMTMVQRENPELFDLYYGDYQGIVSNYIYPIHNIHLILLGIQKNLDYNNIDAARTTLRYCLPYFMKNPSNELAYQYMQQYIRAYNYNVTDDAIELNHLVKDQIGINELLHYNEMFK